MGSNGGGEGGEGVGVVDTVCRGEWRRDKVARRAWITWTKIAITYAGRWEATQGGNTTCEEQGQPAEARQGPPHLARSRNHRRHSASSSSHSNPSSSSASRLSSGRLPAAAWRRCLEAHLRGQQARVMSQQPENAWNHSRGPLQRMSAPRLTLQRFHSVKTAPRRHTQHPLAPKRPPTARYRHSLGACPAPVHPPTPCYSSRSPCSCLAPSSRQLQHVECLPAPSAPNHGHLQQLECPCQHPFCTHLARSLSSPSLNPTLQSPCWRW